MDCEEIKKIIPRYFQHTAAEEEVRLVEEHLCVCHDCRTALGGLMDKLDESKDSTSKEPKDDTLEIVSDEVQKGPVLNKAESAGLNKDEGIREENGESSLLETPEEYSKEQAEKEADKPKPEEEEKKIEYLSKESPSEEIAEPSMDKDEGSLNLETEELPKDTDDFLNKSEELTEDEVEPSLREEDSPDYSLDTSLSKENKIGLLEYICLGIGLIIFIFFIYLLTKG